MRSCYKYNIENVSFLIKAECVIKKIKSLKVKSINYKTYHTETAFE